MAIIVEQITEVATDILQRFQTVLGAARGFELLHYLSGIVEVLPTGIRSEEFNPRLLLRLKPTSIEGTLLLMYSQACLRLGIRFQIIQRLAFTAVM